MKNLIKNTIIKQAIELGFDFEQLTDDTDLQQVNQALKDFFDENSHKLERVEDACEVTSDARTQYVRYGDFWASGEIVDFFEIRRKPAGTKIFHSDFIFEDKDGLVKHMNLYCVVTDNE